MDPISCKEIVSLRKNRRNRLENKVTRKALEKILENKVFVLFSREAEQFNQCELLFFESLLGLSEEQSIYTPYWYLHFMASLLKQASLYLSESIYIITSLKDEIIPFVIRGVDNFPFLTSSQRFLKSCAFWVRLEYPLKIPYTLLESDPLYLKD